MSSSRESFLENWNNTRSRKSTLTQSLNEFSINQQVIYHQNHHCRDLKQGYLFKKKVNKNAQSHEGRSFFKIIKGELWEFESEETSREGFEPLGVFDLHTVKKCYLHPEKNYIFIVEFPEIKLHLKAETSAEARGWVKNIYE